MVFLSVLTISCKKENVTVGPEKEGPFKVTKLLPLSDDIPYQALGSGKILFERTYDQGGSSFYIIDVDNKKSSGFSLGSSITQPCISPSGNKIACALLNSANLKSTWNIYVMNTDGSDCVPAFVSDLPANFPTWNFDGSKIVYYTSGSDARLYMQSPVENASDRVELVKFYDDGDPDWLVKPVGGFTVSPTGKLVSVSTSKKLDGLIDIEPFTGKEGIDVILSPYTDLDFVSPNFRVESPVFSPDGSRIAFLSIYTNPAEGGWMNVMIDIIDPDGSNLVPVGGMGGYQPHRDLPRYVSLCWSPDGTKVLFAMPDGEKTCHIFVVNLDGSGYSQVTNQMNIFDSNVSWSR